METAGALKRKDTTKGPPLRLLSLDGGGVRGYSMIIILQEIMHRTYVEMHGKAPRRHEIPKPCDHFDLIVGTGTGGLIALMLGRLRLDLETCKEIYVRMTRRVFETDKTIAGIPYRSTLFKASMLEQAIREAVWDHTVEEDEGNDGSAGDTSSLGSGAARATVKRHASNASIASFSARSPAAQMSRPAFTRGRGGDPNARLYDTRQNRTKTAVTAMYQGAPKGEAAVMLRSYDSRKEPAPEYGCSIWEAGRATCAIGLAFKPIRIGQSLFHDDGAGKFNPAISTLDEATVNEWPGREVGVFLSIGTGKRPKNTDQASHLWYEGFMGEFAEARRRMIEKIEGCQAVHLEVVKEHLSKRGVNASNYYRLNVEVGVGEWGMNEWHRLSEISSSTRRYLSRHEEQRMIYDCSAKLAKVNRAKQRYDTLSAVAEVSKPSIMEPFNRTLAVELPGDFPIPLQVNPNSTIRQSYDSAKDLLSLPDGTSSPVSSRSSADQSRPRTSQSASPPRVPHKTYPLGQAAQQRQTDDPDRLVSNAPTPEQFRQQYRSEVDKKVVPASVQYRPQQHQPHIRIEGPPPLPPKTPLHHRPATSPGVSLPYPIDDEQAPPPVNMTRKPEYRGR